MDYGAIIADGGIVSGGPADKAGLQARDIIIALNGDRIDSNNPLGSKIQQSSPGDEIEITFLRNGKEQKTKVKLSSTE